MGCEAGVVYTVTIRCATVQNVDYILLLANYTVDFRNLSIEKYFGSGAVVISLVWIEYQTGP